MPDDAAREPARDPQDLERLLVTRERARDVEGMMALYEPPAVVDCGEGRLLRGTDAIWAYLPAWRRRAGNSPSASSARP